MCKLRTRLNFKHYRVFTRRSDQIQRFPPGQQVAPGKLLTQLGVTTHDSQPKLPWAYIPAIGISKRITRRGQGYVQTLNHTPSRREFRLFWYSCPMALHIQLVAHTRGLLELYVFHV